MGVVHGLLIGKVGFAEDADCSDYIMAFENEFDVLLGLVSRL